MKRKKHQTQRYESSVLDAADNATIVWRQHCAYEVLGFLQGVRAVLSWLCGSACEEGVENPMCYTKELGPFPYSAAMTLGVTSCLGHCKHGLVQPVDWSSREMQV